VELCTTDGAGLAWHPAAEGFHHLLLFLSRHSEEARHHIAMYDTAQSSLQVTDDTAGGGGIEAYHFAHPIAPTVRLDDEIYQGDILSHGLLPHPRLQPGGQHRPAQGLRECPHGAAIDDLRFHLSQLQPDGGQRPLSWRVCPIRRQTFALSLQMMENARMVLVAQSASDGCHWSPLGSESDDLVVAREHRFIASISSYCHFCPP
jgi:hypothetical protein